jgi:transposase
MPIKKEVNLRVTSQARSAELNAIAGSEIRAVVGIDLGDKRSSYCLLDTRGGDLGDGVVSTTAEALRLVFAGKGKMRIAIECGTHSPWVSRLLQELGHDVIVANPRRLRFIAESNRKNDKADARTLATVTQAAPGLLKQVHHRSERVQLDLARSKLAILQCRREAAWSRRSAASSNPQAEG